MQFVDAPHAFQRLSQPIRAKITAAQEAAHDPILATAGTLCAAALDSVKLAIAVPPEWNDRPSDDIADLGFKPLVETFIQLQTAQDVPHHVAQLSSVATAQRLHLLRAFAHPDNVVEKVRSKVEGIVRNDFPTKASDIECGRNPGDVLDPYILAATQYLVCGGDFQRAVSATVAHKALMIIEGLMGHLHEDIVGDMRGNIRVPEPRGEKQAVLDVETNPFPGADVMQPPLAPGERPKFHQIKSKTGSAKGGDGERLGLQLKALADFYDGEIYYDALIGNTLRGHRSWGGVKRAAPEVVVLVGEAAFQSLTRSRIGPELLLRVYQTAFQEAAAATGYDIEVMTAAIFQTFATKAEAAGEGYLESILHDATGGPVTQQDSREFVAPPRGRLPRLPSL